jgi:hypothetical protein
MALGPEREYCDAWDFPPTRLSMNVPSVTFPVPHGEGLRAF